MLATVFIFSIGENWQGGARLSNSCVFWLEMLASVYLENVFPLCLSSVYVMGSAM